MNASFLFLGFTLGFNFALLLVSTTRWGTHWMKRVLRGQNEKL